MQESRYKYTSRLKSVWSNKYFDWLVTQMDEQNEIYVGVRSERQFNSTLSNMGIAPPSSRTMKDVMKELVAERLLIRIGWGQYRVNPVIAWNGKVAKRNEVIKDLWAKGINLHPNVEAAPQSTEIMQHSAPSLSRDENSQEIIIEEVTGNENSQATDNKGVI